MSGKDETPSGSADQRMGLGGLRGSRYNACSCLSISHSVTEYSHTRGIPIPYDILCTYTLSISSSGRKYDRGRQYVEYGSFALRVYGAFQHENPISSQLRGKEEER